MWKKKTTKKSEKGKEATLLQLIYFKTGILPVFFFLQKRMKSHVMLQHLLQASCNKALRWAGRDKSKKDKDRNTLKEELSCLNVNWTKRSIIQYDIQMILPI